MKVFDNCKKAWEASKVAVELMFNKKHLTLLQVENAIQLSVGSMIVRLQ